MAILVLTGWNSVRNWLQQSGRPQMPIPPSIFASSRTPICRSSIRLRNTPGEVLDQLAEVDAPVAGEVKGYLVALEAYLIVHELHVEAVGGDLLAAYHEGFALPLAVYLLHAAVALRRDAHDGAYRRDDLLVGDIVVPGHAGGVFEALARLDNDVLPGRNLELVRVEVIGLSAALEFDADHFGHIVIFQQFYSSFLYAVHGQKGHDAF